MIPFLIDVDGVMCDGVYYPSMERKYNLKDGHGVGLLKEHTNIEPIIMSGESDLSIKARAHKLGIRCYTGIDNKFESVMKLHVYSEFNLDDGFVAIGDDVQDIQLLDHAMLCFCPADAHNDVKKIDGIVVLEKRGGEGCVREAIDMILTQPWIQHLFKDALQIK